MKWKICLRIRLSLAPWFSRFPWALLFDRLTCRNEDMILVHQNDPSQSCCICVSLYWGLQEERHVTQSSTVHLIKISKCCRSSSTKLVYMSSQKNWLSGSKVKSVANLYRQFWCLVTVFNMQVLSVFNPIFYISGKLVTVSVNFCCSVFILRRSSQCNSN